MAQEFVFDMPHTKRITKARIDFLNTLLPGLINTLGFKTALDAGCRVGYFSCYLADLGLQVSAVDGRCDNIVEAQRRHPQVRFSIHNIEDQTVRQLGVFDLVLCCGLLYHLENPFAALCNLYALTGRVLLIESMVVPSALPIVSLLDEGRSEDQSLNYIAFVPSESCLTKMLYRAGFPYVYAVTTRAFRKSLISYATCLR
jgi:tRNA (mo5U34)-methyltransferase